MKIPFTTEQFFQVIENYNKGSFPAQIIIAILSVVAFLLVFSEKEPRNKLIGIYLGLLWIWIGWVYHLSYFTAINPAANGFGWFFIAQGFLTLFYTFRNRLLFDFKANIKDYTGIFLILFGLIIYPVISYIDDGSWLKTISMGLPCPSTILTFGFFTLSTGRFPKILLVIPFLWSVLGVSAAMNFGVHQDLMLIVAAIIANGFLLTRVERRQVHSVGSQKKVFKT